MCRIIIVHPTLIQHSFHAPNTCYKLLRTFQPCVCVLSGSFQGIFFSDPSEGCSTRLLPRDVLPGSFRGMFYPAHSEGCSTRLLSRDRSLLLWQRRDILNTALL